MTENWRELRFAIVRKVPAGLIQAHATDVRRIDWLITASNQLALDEVFERGPDRRPFRQPQTKPLANFVADRKQVQLLSQNPVVSAFSFIHLLKVSVQV